MNTNATATARMRKPLPEQFFTEISKLFGDRFTTNAGHCMIHGSDESSLKPIPPDGVVFANTTEEVSQIAKLCSKYFVPMIAYGAGTSLEGYLHAVSGGISIDLSNMNAILNIRKDDLDVTVQAGVTRKQLNNNLHGTGLFFPIDPGADATIGGMAATRASGTNAVRYGTMRENILCMTVVMADGEIVKVGGRSRKTAAGYDLGKLFIGSGGTLGIITELTVRLHPLPEAVSAVVCSFPTVYDAVQTVIQTIQVGVPIARIELLDALAIKAINQFSKTRLTETPTLFFEFHGSPHGVEEQARVVEDLALENNRLHFDWATKPEERSQLWQARHDALYAAINLKPGSRSLTTDVCVPISRLADCITQSLEDLNMCGLTAPLVGHVGDGNFHLLILVDPESGEEIELAERFAHRLAHRAIDMEGTCTGEHGIGTGKLDFMVKEHGVEAVGVMKKIKAALDPENLMNPGKILPH